jgi:3-oxoacyl-(acyl-carrier-protein) synthase
MILGFSQMRAVATRYNDTPDEASRPFDRDRDGFVLGEGAWMVVLEREERARARGARIYAAVEGYGSTCDAYHQRADGSGRRADRARHALAVERSGRGARRDRLRQLSRHVHALNDAVESRCVRRFFGAGAERVPGSSTKSMVGIPRAPAAPAASSHPRWRSRAAFLPPTINQAQRRSGLRSRFHPQHRPRRLARRRAVQLPRLRVEEQRDRPRRAPVNLVTTVTPCGVRLQGDQEVRRSGAIKKEKDSPVLLNS